ncbi:hypothetical protein OBBRIDRAFT_794652 [Obba rivulosa]|uniref:Elongator complex protein 6 n=1 Tax=Obba rivulosa TaxID=1052685 RepID=A0A8E2ARK0_9APHY|nr:hypothetical protein OBBRIDRAFT_794652 [Obba rivulosa]
MSSASFPPARLPLPRELLLITDELQSPADFLLFRGVFAHLKDTKNARCVVASVSGDETIWRAMAGKMSVNYAQCLASQRLVYLDAMAHADVGAMSPSLVSLFRALQDTLDAQLSDPDAPTLLVLDDIAALEWMGVSELEVSRFARAIYALCRKTNAALILRHHVVTPGEPDDLLRHLLQLCTYHLDVFPLSSGRSGAVHGQIALHTGPGVAGSHKLITRTAALQYRLTDSGAVFFDRGTGGGVL